MNYIYVFLRIVRSNSYYFHIHFSRTGLFDGNTVPSAGYELRLHMHEYM